MFVLTFFPNTNKISWVYQRSFVADENFKADHVRQNAAATDIWLSEGGGMTGKRSEYEQFLKTAVERATVSTLQFIYI